MLASILFVTGLLATDVAVAALTSPWWALLALGVQLVAGGVLTEANTAARKSKK